MLPLLPLVTVWALAVAHVVTQQTDMNVHVCSDNLCTQNCTPYLLQQQECTSDIPYTVSSSFICGDHYTVQTIYKNSGCGTYSDRTSRLMATNSCVLLLTYPAQFIRVECFSQQTISRTTSMIEDSCSLGSTSDVALGSCNNVQGENGVEFSLIPTCEQGYAFVRYFSGVDCLSEKVSTFYASGVCQASQLGAPVSVMYTCPYGTLERACLNVRSPWFVISGVALALVFVITLPISYCCVAWRTNTKEELSKPLCNDNYIGMDTLQHDVDELVRYAVIQKLNERVKELHEGPVAAGGDDLSHRLFAQAAENGLDDADKKAIRFSTISGFSSETVRGSQFLLASSATASTAFCMLAGINQSLEVSDRPTWAFFVTFAAYASLIIAGVVPTPNISRKSHRKFHISCCCSFGENSTLAKVLHLGSTLTFLFVPSLVTLAVQCSQSEEEIDREGRGRHMAVVVLSGITLGCAGLFALFALVLSEKFPAATFFVEATTFFVAIMSTIASETISLVTCLVPQLG